jgi:hypothetical protein
MMRFSGCLLLFSFGLISQLLMAQERSDVIQQRIEFISEQLAVEDIDLTNVIEVLNYYYENPINLNSASSQELQEMNLLTDIQIAALLLHIKLFGKLITIYELQSLEYWDLQTIRLVLPFVRVDDRLDNLHVSLREAVANGKFEWFARYQRVPEQKSGYRSVSDSVLQSSNSFYYGNADHYYTRLRYSYLNNVSFGVTADKDPGEQFFKGTQPNGFDFYSAHAFFKGGKYVKAIALGDYQIQIGQGLNLWSGYAFGKTADVMNLKRTANPIRPYTSVDETRFMRGVAVDLGLGPLSLLVFGSSKKIDALIANDSTEFVSSISLSGLHRTNLEIERKDELSERIAGANLRFRRRNLQMGMSGVYQGYETYFNKEMAPYNQFDFRGKEFLSFSADYTYVFRNFNFFGESSRSSFNGAWAHVHGVLCALDSRASVSLLYRNYSRGYQTFYNNGFSEGSRTQNESGFYAGVKLKVNSYWMLNAYMDVFSFPWMKYGVDAPSNGHELLIQPSFKPNKKLEIYGRLRQQLRQKNARFQEGMVTPIENVMQRNYRLNMSYVVSDQFTVKSRIELAIIDRQNSPQERGLIVTQDIQFKPKNLPLEVSLRYALFDTDSYDTRIYTYESNALYAFTVPSYYYQGSRAYVLVRYSLTNHFDIWLRYGNFIYNNRSVIGSGAEQINGNRKSDVTVQIRMKF